MRRCCECRAEKSLSDFNRYRNGHQKMCRSCQAIYNRAHYRQRKAADPQRVYSRKRAVALKYKYGIDQTQYDAMLAAQGGVCAICRKHETATYGERAVYPLAVDHDHVSGQVRGLLCIGCNAAIAHFRDDPESVRRAIAYLYRLPPFERWTPERRNPTDEDIKQAMLNVTE